MSLEVSTFKRTPIAEIIAAAQAYPGAGMVVLGTELSAADVEAFSAVHKPLVFLDTYHEFLPFDFVDMNNLDAVFTVVSHLQARGHRRIGMVKGSLEARNLKLREEAFAASLARCGLPYDERHVFAVDPTFHGAYDDMLAILRRDPPLPTALFCGNDIIACGCLKALTARKIRVPEDVSLVGLRRPAAGGGGGPAAHHGAGLQGGDRTDGGVAPGEPHPIGGLDPSGQGAHRRAAGGAAERPGPPGREVISRRKAMANFSIILGNLGNTCDRFLSTGYKDQPSKEVMIRQASEIPGVKGVELVGTWDVTRENVDEIGGHLAKHGLACVSIIPDHFSQKRWGRGAFTSKDPGIRAQALEETMAAAELARKLRCPLINLWPGQDGYDYPLQADYRLERRWLIEAVTRAAKAYPDIKFALEYKPKEPRTHSFMARAADTLLVAREVNLPNVGVTIDTGHALVAGENVAEAAVLLTDYGAQASSTCTSTTTIAPGTTT